MERIEEMNKWNYMRAWKFFTENAFNRYIPETELYIRSLDICRTIDIRGDKNAKEKLLAATKIRSLILIDGCSLNGKSTFAERLAKEIDANIVDIDILCKEWVEEEQKKVTNFLDHLILLQNMDRLTDQYLLENLERIIRQKSGKSVILVGSYMEAIYRAIIAKTLGKYFGQVVSIYCCAKTFDEVKKMKKHRESQFGVSLETDQEILNQYNYSMRLMIADGILLGVGMTHSFISDNSVSNLFV